jgi:hypothetical protein
MRGYVLVDSFDELSLGDFVRYKTKQNGVTKYRIGGVVVFIHEKYVRLKNVRTNASWSVTLDDTVTFYKKYKMTAEDVDAYTELSRDDVRLINLNAASSRGLLDELVARGDHELIVRYAKKKHYEC